MNDRFKFRIWNGAEMHYNDFVVTATGFVGKITEEFLGRCVFNQEDLTADKECTLMQCTGLKDKNGKLIYEGDIVEFPNPFNPNKVFRQVVEWKELALTIGYSFTPFTALTVEVIGNIYENKELLNDN